MLQLILLVLVVVLSYAYFSRSKLSIPGPKGLPLVGFGPFIGDKPHETFMKLSETYGPVFKIQLGYQEWIILNSKDAIQEAFIKNGKHASGRVNNVVMTAMVGERSMGFSTNMNVWRSQRDFVTKAMKSYGPRKMEQVIKQETEFLHHSLSEKNGKSFDCQSNILKAVCNVACQMILGRRYEYNDKKYNTILMPAEILSRGDVTTERFASMVNVAFLRFLPGYNKLFRASSLGFQELRREIANHVEMNKTTPANNVAEDLTEEFLLDISESNQTDSLMHSVSQIPYIMQDLIVGSSDTTTSTIRWCILGLCTNHEYQKRIYKEILDVLEMNGRIDMGAQTKMPFTRAYIQEIMRFCGMAPLGIPHCSTEDFILSGYEIPKDTPIMANLWAVHRNPTAFKNPDQFQPERFLDIEGNFVSSDDMMPFSVGPRRCPGEQLAKLELFLFVAHLVSKFYILPDEDGPDMRLGDGMMIFTFAPKQFRARFVPRK